MIMGETVRAPAKVVDNAPVLGMAYRAVACGMAVLPLVYRNKRPVAGFEWKPITAPQTLDEIEGLFSPAPALNIGILCGRPSGGLLVIDIDGALALESVLDADPKLAGTWVVHTGRTAPGPGYHVYVRAAGPIPTIHGGPLHEQLGLDIQGTGAYVVTPPSVHASGQSYATKRGEPEGIVHVGDAGSFLRALLGGLGVR
jgi:hypothetical protein